MKRKSLGVNALINSIRSVVNLIFPLITFPYVSRILSVNGMGIYNFSSTYVGYFLLLAGLGIYTYAIREGAKFRNDREKMSQFASQVFTINIVSTLIAYVLLLLSLLIFKNLNNYVSAILIFSLQIIFTTIGTEWIYTIYEEYNYITIRSILFKIISMILLFLLVKKASDYLVYVSISVFASVGSNVLNFIHSKSYCSIKLVKNVDWYKHLKPIIIIFASSLAINIYVSSDTTILGLLKDDYAVGIYGLSVKIYSISESLMNAVMAVTIPRLAMLFGRKKYKEYNLTLKNIINFLILLILPGCVGIMMLSKEIVLIIAGKKYLESVNSLRIIIWAIIFSIFSWLFMQCVLIPAKREAKVLRNTIITAIVNIILNFILIPFLSYDGTSLSTVLAQLMVMLMNGYSSWDIVKPVILRKETLYNLIEAIVGCVGIVIICVLCNIGFNSLILKTGVSIVLSIIIYGAILVVLQNKIALSMLDKLKMTVKNVL